MHWQAVVIHHAAWEVRLAITSPPPCQCDFLKALFQNHEARFYDHCESLAPRWGFCGREAALNAAKPHATEAASTPKKSSSAIDCVLMTLGICLRTSGGSLFGHLGAFFSACFRRSAGVCGSCQS